MIVLFFTLTTVYSDDNKEIYLSLIKT